MAAGEGAVWVLNDGEDRVSRIDPETKKVTGAFETPRTPTQLATGAGALWVGNGGGRFVTSTVSISRVDPRSAKVTRTVKLPDDSDGGFTTEPNTGFAQIAVGAGACWARNPDGTISRLDAETGEQHVETIDVDASTVAAGKEGVWFVPKKVQEKGPPFSRGGSTHARTGSHETIRTGATTPQPAIAVGAGSVWATAENERGLVFRIESGGNDRW